MGPLSFVLPYEDLRVVERPVADLRRSKAGGRRVCRVGNAGAADDLILRVEIRALAVVVAPECPKFR